MCSRQVCPPNQFLLFPRFGTTLCRHTDLYGACACFLLVSPPIRYWKGVGGLPNHPPMCLTSLVHAQCSTSSCHHLAQWQGYATRLSVSTTQHLLWTSTVLDIGNIGMRETWSLPSKKLQFTEGKPSKKIFIIKYVSQHLICCDIYLICVSIIWYY